jgi:uncharacterized membrane protein YbaN (DUF454 family)
VSGSTSGFEARTVLRSPRRLALAALGVVCVALGLAGVVVPGLPTTVFLIAASYLFTRSCPYLEERLLGLRVFQPYLRYVRGDAAMPLKARVMVLVMMWAAVATSLATLAFRGRLEVWVAALLLAAAIAGSTFVWTYARRRPAPVPAGPPERAPVNSEDLRSGPAPSTVPLRDR